MCLPRPGAPSAQSSQGPFGSCTQTPSASRHHYPRSTPLAKSAPGAAAAAERKCPQGLLCPDLSVPCHFIFLCPAPTRITPMSLGTCSAAARSSVMSKRTALAPLSPAIRACRDTQQKPSWGQRRTHPIHAQPHILSFPGSCTHHTPAHLHVRGQRRTGTLCPALSSPGSYCLQGQHSGLPFLMEQAFNKGFIGVRWSTRL